MAAMEPASVDAIVTDPPYGLAFMGKEWDHGIPGVLFWSEALRVAKPGAHLAAFGGTRTYHRLACAIEDAGFEIRDCLCWLYGSGFPKSLDVSKAIDKAAGAERPVVGVESRSDKRGGNFHGASEQRPPIEWKRTSAASAASAAWSGWGTALKPAWEPIILARKPLVGTVAANVLEHGTGALNVDGCRIEARTIEGGTLAQNTHLRSRVNKSGGNVFSMGSEPYRSNTAGRWPANVALDEEAAAMLDAQSGDRQSGDYGRLGYRGFGVGPMPAIQGDNGGASRFFYTAKASSGERHYAGRNAHPTVKPVDLMRWLCRLVTPPGGLILDPFCGSGSTGVAALAEGFTFIGCELNADYVAMARRRIAGPLFAEGEK